MVNNNIALLLCGTCRGMTRELTSRVLEKYKDSLQVVSVDCPAEMDPFVVLKMLKTGWSGIIVACPRNACCCPKNRKMIKRREMVRDILPVFNLEKERYRNVNVSPFDFSTLDKVIQEMVAHIELLDGNKDFDRITTELDREIHIPMQIVN